MSRADTTTRHQSVPGSASASGAKAGAGGRAGAGRRDGSVLDGSIGDLRYWQRAILAVAAVHIFDEKLGGEDEKGEDKKGEDKKGEERLQERLPHLAGLSRDCSMDGFNGELFGLYGGCRNFLAHIRYAPIVISPEMKDFLRLAYMRKSVIGEVPKFFVGEGGEQTFTIRGIIYFLCMALDRKRAYQLINQFKLTGGMDDEKSAELKKNFTAYSIKGSFNVARHEFARAKEYTEWQLFCEIIAHITKPLKDSPGAALPESDVRTQNPYMIDYFIVRWIELKNALPNVEWARSIPWKGENKDTFKNKPFFEDDGYTKQHLATLNKPVDGQEGREGHGDTHTFKDLDYYRFSGQYWCRIQTDGSTPPRVFKLHRKHLRSMARILLADEKAGGKATGQATGEATTNIMEAMEQGLNAMQSADAIEQNKAREKNAKDSEKKFRKSLPRTWRDDWHPEDWEGKKNARLAHYNAEKIKAMPIGKQAQFILWALQHALNPNPKAQAQDRAQPQDNAGMLSTGQYQRASAVICYYAKSNAHFQEEVRKKLHPYMEEHIKHSIAKTIDGICQKLLDINYEDDAALQRRHRFREKPALKENHWLSSSSRNKADTVWLPKHAFDALLNNIPDMPKHGWLPPDRNYHKDIRFSSEKKRLYYLPEGLSSAEKGIRKHALSVYAQDILLVQIIKSSQFSSDIIDGSGSPAIGNLHIRMGNYRIPLKHLGKNYIPRDKAQLNKRLDLAKRELTRQRKRNKPKPDEILKYYFEKIEPQYMNIAHLFLARLFEIEERIIKRNNVASNSGGYIGFPAICKAIFPDDPNKQKLLRQIRNDCLHGHIFLEEEREEEFDVVDEASTRLKLRCTLDEKIRQAREKKKERMKNYAKR